MEPYLNLLDEQLLRDSVAPSPACAIGCACLAAMAQLAGGELVAPKDRARWGATGRGGVRGGGGGVYCSLSVWIGWGYVALLVMVLGLRGGAPPRGPKGRVQQGG